MIRSHAIHSRLVGPGLAILLIMGLAACGGPPKWVEKGSGALMKKTAKRFTGWGLSRASGMRRLLGIRLRIAEGPRSPRPLRPTAGI